MSRYFSEPSEENINKHMLKEFGKSKKDLDEDIEILRKWADTQPHFPEKPSYRLNRCMILFNKFSIEKAKQKLDMYYSIRTMIPEFFKCQPFRPEMALLRRVAYIVPLPKTTPDNSRVIYIQINPNYNAEYFNDAKLLESFCNVAELIIQEDNCCRFHYIFDCAGIKLAHIPKFGPMIIKKGSFVSEQVFSNRIASFYMVNFESIMETLLNTIIKPMLNAKLRSRLKVHSGTDILLEVFGKEIMPKDIGGSERSLDELTDLLEKVYEEKKDRFEVLQTLKVDESLRPKKLVNDEILGYYGNFKKIDVD